MAEARLITIPDFDFSEFYYPDFRRALIQFTRANVPEITDEAEEEPFQQLQSSFALVGHLNNVLLDISANETYLPTSRLLDSIKLQLKLIDVALSQATPASADVVLEFSKVFEVATNVVSLNSQFATEETDENPQIIFETNNSVTIQRTDQPTGIFSFTSGKITINSIAYDANDSVTIEGVEFKEGVAWITGGVSIAGDCVLLAAAINTSAASAILGRVFALFDGVDTLSIIPLAQDVETITISETDGATDNFTVASAGFGVNRAIIASTAGLFFDLFDATPKAGDIIYIGHGDIMWDTLEFVFNSFGAGLELVIEFFDNDFEDQSPDTVTNLGAQLDLDLTGLLGTDDRSGSVIRVLLNASGASETVVSTFVGGVNKVITSGLLGQSVVSTDADDYAVGSQWNEVSDVVDDTASLVDDGKISYTLPQNLSQNWVSTTINAIAARWIRIRVISVAAPVNPVVDRIRIDTGKQSLLVPVSQGQTVADDPLGSSNGGADQEFILTFRPLIEGTLIFEADEGSGFESWNKKDNFLSSNSASKDFTLDIAGNDIARIKTGDGTNGKIPTAGVDNIRAIYRIGADQDGNVGAQTINVNKSGLAFVSKLFNPRQATGFTVKDGATEADRARLKVEGPASLRTRERALSIPDFEFLATEFVGSAGSKLASRALGIEETFGVKTVEVVVVGIGGILLTEAQRNELRDFFNGDKSKGIEPSIISNHEATIVNYTPKIIDVTATVTNGVEEEIKNAVIALLNPDATFSDGVTKRWAFGQEVPTSIIQSAIFDTSEAITKVVLTLPPADVILSTRELPLAGTVLASVI